jgi:hypothetical protein
MISAIFRSECHLPPTNRETFVQNYKESFLFESDTSSFSRLVKSLLVSDAL